MKNDTSSTVRLTVRFILFHSELTLDDPCCNLLQTLLRQKKYEKEMSDEQPP